MKLLSKCCLLYLFYNRMGGQDSKPIEEDYFLLEHVSKMTMTSRKSVSYYFIHFQSADHKDMLTQLRNYFKLDYFREIKTLKQEMSFVHKNQIVKVIVTDAISQTDMAYLHQEKKINQIIIFGEGKILQQKYSKVIGWASSTQSLISLLNSLQEKDLLDIPSSNLLLLNDQDTKLVNKYRLNYHCNTHFSGRQKAKLDFIELAKKLYPHQQSQIEQFQKQYKLQLAEEERNQMVLNWIFKQGFYWDMVNLVTRNSTDPKQLAYVRLALKDIYETIFSRFKKQKLYEDIYVVVDITEEQKSKLEKSKGNFLLFTSFVKGYLTQKQANAQLKLRPNAFRFVIAPNRTNLEESLNFGYLMKKDAGKLNIVFNIYNVFMIDDINVKTRRAELLYGALPQTFVKRKEEDSRGKMTILQLNLMRNYDYLEDMLANVDSQATLLQLSGYYKESLQVYDKKVDFIRQSNDNQEIMNKCLIRKGDALRVSGDYENAQKQYQAVSSKSQKFRVISLIHLASLYAHTGEEKKFQKTIDQIQPQLKIIQKSDKEQYLKGSNYVVVQAIKRSNYKKAIKMLQELKKQVSLLYQYSLEGKPLVHDIYRSLATCKSKMGLHEDALGLLKSTLQWQLVCQGKTQNVALTQTLIQSVSRSSGNSSQLKDSLARLSSMSEQIQSSERRFESPISVSLQQSLINIPLP